MSTAASLQQTAAAPNRRTWTDTAKSTASFVARTAIPAAATYFVADTLVEAFAPQIHDHVPHPHVPNPSADIRHRVDEALHPPSHHVMEPFNQGVPIGAPQGAGIVAGEHGPLGPGPLRPPEMPPINVPPPPGWRPEPHEIRQAEDAVADAIGGAAGMAVGCIIAAPLGPLAPVVGAALGAGVVALGHLIRGR